MSTDAGNGFPNSTLCTYCTNLKLTAANFYLSEEEAKETPNPRDVYDLVTIDTRKWQDVEANKECDFCRLIKSAVESSRFEWQSSEPPNTCEIKMKRLHGSFAKNYDVRCLEVVAHYDWTSSHDILLLPVESDVYPGCFPGRVIDPRGVGIERIRAWMDQCQSRHGDKCRQVETPQFQRIRGHILVYDVNEQCLVRLPPNARYIALSYVWGNVAQPKTVIDNIESFIAQNGLSSVYHQLPKVILDAVRFMKAFGERYLWVDTLCIIQDDPDFKKVVINSMHTVYENAYLTLFAATGTDSNSGLPGVQPIPRGVSQLITKISDGLQLIFPINYQHIKRSTWARRAWTYQEYFFAKRRLLFVDGQVVYQCNTVRWREDIAQEHLEKGLVHYQSDSAGSRMDWEPPVMHFANAPSDKWSRYHLNRYIQTYLDRNLTFDTDILSAFAGITNEAENKKLKTCWGLTEKHVGMDILWIPCKWLVRRPGFPSWSWVGWKGSVICYGGDNLSSEEIWQHRTSWIDWYIFKKSSGKFHLLSSGYVPQQETVITQKEGVEHIREERLAAMRSGREDGEDSNGQDEAKHRVASERGALASLLWRLCQSNSVTAPSKLESPYPLYCTPTIDDQTLLFRTLTGYVSISSLNPSGKMSLPPRDDQLLLPSAPTLHLYAPDGTHIGTAWSHTQQFFDKVASYDRKTTALNPNAARLKIEIALIAGPVDGDWRTRNEKLSTWQYMLELAKAGLHLGMLEARYQQRLIYEKAIVQIYIDMVCEREVAENGANGTEMRLTVAFWEELEERIALMNLKKGHCEETLRPVIDGLTAAGTGMRAKEGQKFLKVMLIGNLGDGETNGSGGIKERVGTGEIRDNSMGLIQGLASRDVMLR